MQGMFSLVYLMSTDMYSLINYVAFVNWLAIGLSVLALIYFRWSRPDMPRPIKASTHNKQPFSSFIHVTMRYVYVLQVWLGWPIIYCLCSVFLVVVPLYASPFETGLQCAHLMFTSYS